MDLWYSSKEETTPKELAAYKQYLAEIGVTSRYAKRKAGQPLKPC